MMRKLVIHPFLFAIYAVLGVYAANEVEIPVQWVLRPLIVLLLVITGIFIVAYLILKNYFRAGLVTTLILFWIFFGHFYRALFEISPFWNTTPGILLAFLLWTVPLAFLGSPWTWRHISHPGLVNDFLNITSIIVIMYPLYVAGYSLFEISTHPAASGYQNSTLPAANVDRQAGQPDVYLIILDAYGREDFLREIYGFDNHEFIDYLKKKGFYVAEESSPNYPHTSTSLASLLNMQYLDGYVKDFRNTDLRQPVYALIKDSAIRQILHDKGYKFVALPGPTFFTQMHDADVYYQMTPGDINELEGLLLVSSVFNFAINAWHLDIPIRGYDLHRRYLLYALDKLGTMGTVKGPKFVFVHFVAPHPPFVVDKNGNPIQSDRPYYMGDANAFEGSPQEYVSGYLGEVQFLNRRLMGAIDSILAQSAQPPIIIIQGDHGPGNFFNLDKPQNKCLWERYSILNAYYFPDGNYSALYNSITPVNSFRVVLNQYFGTDLALLKDKNYYATWSKPYIFSDVTDQARTCSVEPVK